MKKIISIVVVLVIILILIGLYGAGEEKVEQTVAPIKIGAVISLTGFAAPWGEYAKNGMELAVKEINQNGGMDGRKIELVIEDDHTDGKDAVLAYNKLLAVNGAQGILGGVFDFTAQPLIPLALNNKLPFISGSNFRIAGGFDLNEYSFVMMSDFNKVIRQLQTYLVGEDIKKLAVVHFKSTFGNEIAKTLDEVMKQNGQEGIVDEQYTEIGNNNFRTIITKLKSQKVEAVFLDMVGNDPVNFLSQAKQLGFKAKFISYNGVTDSFAQETDKSLLEGVTILNWEVSSPTFINIYKEAYGIEPTKSADKWFDAVYVLAKSISNNTDSSKIPTYIENNSFTTPNSTIRFTPEHAVESTPVLIQTIKEGQLVEWEGK